MQEIADRLNSLLRERYGLTADVFYVEHDPPGLALIDNDDLGLMHNFAMVLENLCQVFSEHDPRPEQLRMF